MSKTKAGKRCKKRGPYGCPESYHCHMHVKIRSLDNLNDICDDFHDTGDINNSYGYFFNMENGWQIGMYEGTNCGIYYWPSCYTCGDIVCTRTEEIRCDCGLYQSKLYRDIMSNDCQGLRDMVRCLLAHGFVYLAHHDASGNPQYHTILNKDFSSFKSPERPAGLYSIKSFISKRVMIRNKRLVNQNRLPVTFDRCSFIDSGGKRCKSDSKCGHISTPVCRDHMEFGMKLCHEKDKQWNESFNNIFKSYKNNQEIIVSGWL